MRTAPVGPVAVFIPATTVHPAFASISWFQSSASIRFTASTFARTGAIIEPLRILHAIHDFLPRHRAGSEIYALDLCRTLSRQHHVTVLCADYDPARTHGQLTWRAHGGLPVVEVVNNWICRSFEETYRSPLIAASLEHALRAVQPDVLHIHNLLNLSFDLPRIARDRGIAVVATLHDYTLVCASGGQRIHQAENHVCESIDPERCVRCFRQSPFHSQLSFGRMTDAARVPVSLRRAALTASRRLPLLSRRVFAAAVNNSSSIVSRADIEARTAAAARVFEDVDIFVAPSNVMAQEFERLGVERKKIRVSDYGFAPFLPHRRTHRPPPLRIGYVGTLAWHKGVHILLEAIRSLPDASYEVRIFGDPHVFPMYSASLRTQAAGRPVYFMGAFARNEIANVYGSIDVLVVPSLWIENSPLVIHEAFMAGVPVIAARVGGIPDLMNEPGAGILYDARSADELSGILCDFIENPDRVDALSSNTPGVKRLEDDADEWSARYCEAVGGTSARRPS
jgi:glycosyltransferase involved in cell wall biosynthesis